MFAVTQNAELRLSDTLTGISEEAPSWRAVYFGFDLLLEQYRSDYQIHIAVNLLNDLLSGYQGGVFVCVDQSIVLLCRNVTKAQLDKAIFQLRYLFMDDSLAYDVNGDENPRFCRIYDLGVEYAEFHQLCRKKLSQRTQTMQNSEQKKSPVVVDAGANKSSFTPSRLAHIEHDLNKADLSRVLRRQPICAVMADYEVRKIYDELYIHIASLRQLLHSDADFFSNRWLFRYLTQLLDNCVLDLLNMNAGKYLTTAFSVNLNIETILSARFRAFDEAIKTLVKSSVVIEIQLGEVFMDLAPFEAARNMLHSLGYRICLDGITNASILHVDREQLGFDLAKLQWDASLENDINNKENQSIIKAVERCGRNRIILSRCDTRQAINYGQMMKINLFQGRFLDRILNPNQAQEN